MSDDWDDWDYGRDIEDERESDRQHEIDIAIAMNERERNDDERARREQRG